jgi:uncharacterized protein
LSSADLTPLRPGLLAHPSGALWVEDRRALLVADAHLGYAWAQRRRGELGPLQEGGIAELLLSLTTTLQPAELVFLGDVVHAPRPLPEEKSYVESVLQQLAGLVRITIVPGNHDRALVRDFPQTLACIAEEWRHEGLLGLHGDKIRWLLPEADYYVMGHYHPVMSIRDHAGASQQLRAFIVGDKAVLLPAMNPFSRGLDLRRNSFPKELRILFRERAVYLSTGKRVVPLAKRPRPASES